MGASRGGYASVAEGAKGMNRNVKDALIAEQTGRVLRLTINRPDALNALNAEVLSGLRNELDGAARDASVRVVVIAGTGERAFSAGADLDELTGFDPADTRARLRQGQSAIRALETLEKPVIAAVRGYALGGGFELALACSLILGAESAKFGLPEVGLGLIPGYGGTQRLPRLIGRQAALDIILTGERIDARRAYELGILCRAPVPDGDLLATADGLAGEMAHRSPKAMRLALSAVNSTVDLDSALAYETALAALATTSEDAAEGIKAFQEKREPNFDASSG